MTTSTIPTAEGTIGHTEEPSDERLNELFACHVAHLKEPWMPIIGFLDFVNQPDLALKFAPEDGLQINRFNGRWSVKYLDRFCQHEKLGYALVVALLRAENVELND